jgi:hypothetical protein
MNKDSINRYYTTTDSFISILDSRNATQKLNGSYNSNMTFDYSDNLRSNAYKMKVSVLTFSCPNSLYNINEFNNILVLDISGVVSTYSVDYGNYNSLTFTTALLALLPTGFSMVLNSITNKFTISYINIFSILPESTLQEVMGFDYNMVYTSSSNIINLPYTCNFNGLASFNIKFSNISTTNYSSLTNSTGSIIQSIPIQNGAGQISFYKTNNYSTNLNQELDYIQIELVDDKNQHINLNNQHFNLTLLFEYLTEVDKYEIGTNGFHNILFNGYSLE